MDAGHKIQALRSNIERVIKGKPAVVEMAVVALLARGHLLIEDVPGVGKTTLAHSLARSLGCSFRRIQFTSDLLPADILGVSVFHQQKQSFEFKPGPVFAHIVLADEINRTTPKTQSSLLEAMNDAQVSVDSQTYPLPRPFMVIATQNPWEYHGTFPLPESQLDRFLMRIRIGYPDPADEKKVLDRPQLLHPADELQPVLTTQEVLDLQERVEKVRLDDSLMEYLLAIIAATRRSALLMLGVSPRGAMALHKTAKALALVRQRDYCLPDDIKELAPLVLAPRDAEDEPGLARASLGRGRAGHPGSRGVGPCASVSRMRFQRIREFFRWFYRYRSLRLTPEGVRFLLLTLAVGVAALNTGNNLLYLLLAMMLSLIVMSGILSEQCLRHLVIRRWIPDRVFANSPTPVALSLTNRKPRLPSFSLRVLDVVEGKTVDRGIHVLHLPAGASVTQSYPILFPRRGRHRIEGIKVQTRFPFGLFIKVAHVPVSSDLVVYPALQPLPDGFLHDLAVLGHDQAVSRRGQGVGLYNLREYLPGDDSRMIHWKTSARQARLMVRETETEDLRQVTLALPTAIPAEGLPSFEQAVSLTASLAAYFQEQGFAISLLVGEQEILHGVGEEHLYHMLHVLALCAPRHAACGRD